MANQQLQTRTQQGGATSRPRTYDPFNLSLMPLDVLSTSPFSLMRRMLQEVSRPIGAADDVFWTPTTEILERDGSLIVRADLPGLSPDDIKVQAVDGALVIEGERKVEQDRDENGIHRTERQYGRFYRVIGLPNDAQIDKASAKFENGVLEIAVPQPAQKNASSKQIPVQGASTNQAAPDATSANSTSSPSGKQTA